MSAACTVSLSAHVAWWVRPYFWFATRIVALGFPVDEAALRETLRRGVRVKIRTTALGQGVFLMAGGRTIRRLLELVGLRKRPAPVRQAPSAAAERAAMNAAQIRAVKDQAAVFLKMLDTLATPSKPAGHIGGQSMALMRYDRELIIARERVEEAAMWAEKHITREVRT